MSDEIDELDEFDERRLQREQEQSETAAELARIAELTGIKRERALADFHASRQRVYDTFTRNLCKKFGVPSINREDVYQEIAITGIELTEDWDPQSTYRWEVQLYGAARSRIRKLVESGHWDGVGGMTTWHRRRSKLRQTADKLRRTQGTEPTRQEIVDAHNDEAYRRYSDPKRQGMIATIDDLADMTPLSLSGVVRVGEDANPIDVPVMDITDECVLSPMESPEFIAKVIDECYSRSVTLGDVASGWLDSFGSDGAPLRTVPELSTRLGRSYESTRRALIRVKEVAVAVLERDYNITGLEGLSD